MTGYDATSPDFDVIAIGAGVCGIYQAYRLQEMGARFRVLERASGVGGTWHWNRYPGCRFDSESETYGYSFSEELLQNWDWKERYAPREETEAYLLHVVERFGLSEHIQLNATVTSARWDGSCCCWVIVLADGEEFRARFLITAIGLLSSPTPPRYPGVDSFLGQSFHTYYSPREPLDLAGKKVAVIGTGSTGVQLICAIAGEVQSLTIFQRQANWCAPLNNRRISNDEMQAIKGNYSAIFDRCRATPSGFIHDADPRDMFSLSEVEREEFWEALYASSGFAIWLANFKDVLTDQRASDECSRFMEKKIRERVADQSIADKLVPKEHTFGTRRPPMEAGYYELFNENHVHLIDLNDTPIERITPTGIKTTEDDLEFDVIIYATGFDAVTGSFDKIEIVGRDGRTLKEKWKDGPQTAFGMAIEGFPNLITLAGPQSGSVATNFPRGIEDAVDWSTNLLLYMREKGYAKMEPMLETEQSWVHHAKRMAEKVLFAQGRSWFTGYNSNVDREYVPKCLVYAGGAIRFRSMITEEAERGYPGFAFA